MRLLILSAVLILSNLTATVAQDIQFPYDAVVQSDEDVRSGPGEKKYYATGRVHRGDRVRVHRHDLGGWYLISPPADSFCWIRADFVERNSEQSGVVKHRDKVPVYVGSSLREEHHSVCQRRLADGDEVRILGARQLTGANGLEDWYKIAPPANEFRWIHGRCIAPHQRAQETARRSASNPGVQEQVTIVELEENTGARRPGQEAGPDSFRLEPIAQENDDFSDPSSNQPRGRRARRRPSIENPEKGSGIVRSGPTAQELAEDRKELHALDAQLKEILNDDTGNWDFAELEQACLEFRSDAPYQTLRNQIDLRLAQIAEYKEIQRQYVDFMRIAQRTVRHDASLLAERRGVEVRLEAQRPVEAIPQMQPQAQEVSIRQVAVPQQGRPEWALPPEHQHHEHQHQHVQQQQQRFEGAGIVQHVVRRYPGGPIYKLVAPDGRFLAYLYPAQGMNLEEVVGQSMGLNGPRRFDPNYRADFITVNTWTPVRLER